MSNINSQFIPYNLALKLKELGFNEMCIATYDEHGEFSLQDFEQNYDTFPKHIIAAPPWEQAFDWFREKYNLHALNSPLLNNEWSVVIDNTLNSNQVYWGKKLGYQEARQDCLEKLIELCKKNL
jgi:hypothetical protein